MKKPIFYLAFCTLLGLFDESLNGVSAQESTDEIVNISAKSRFQNSKLAAPMSDWMVNGTKIYNLATNVGLGSTNPVYKLDVIHSGSTGIVVASVAGFSVVDIDAFNGDAALRLKFSGATQWNFRNQPTTNNLQIMDVGVIERFQIQNTTGNVGISDTNPVARLSVGGNVKIADGTQAIGRVLTSDANGVASWQANPTSPFLVSGGNIYYPSGNVGIGTSVPNGKLQFNNVLANRMIVLNEEANNDHQYYGFGINSGTLRYQVGTGGNHIFYANINGSSSKELFKIASNGNVTASGVILFSSDKRLKKDIVPLRNVLPKLTALTGYNYNWIDKNNSEKQQIGLIAQEVEKIYPELVETDVNGYKSVNYNGLIPVLLEGIKDLQKQLDERNSDFDKLKSDMEAIKIQINKLSASNLK